MVQHGECNDLGLQCQAIDKDKRYRLEVCYLNYFAIAKKGKTLLNGVLTVRLF